MKIWPFWRFWYFSREQRWALFLVSICMLLLAAAKGPVYNYILKKRKERWEEINKKEWMRIKDELAKSRNAAINDKTSHFYTQVKTDTTYGQKHDKKDIKSAVIIDINKANAQDWQALRGIGPVLSERIVKYRDKLGGFYGIDQIAEVYGLDDSVFMAIRPQLKLGKINLKKLNPNKDDVETLSQHPYISKTLAKQMVGYRTKVKEFESAEDLRKLYNMNDSLFDRLIHYLTFEQ